MISGFDIIYTGYGSGLWVCSNALNHSQPFIAIIHIALNLLVVCTTFVPKQLQMNAFRCLYANKSPLSRYNSVMLSIPLS